MASLRSGYGMEPSRYVTFTTNLDQWLQFEKVSCTVVNVSFDGVDLLSSNVTTLKYMSVLSQWTLHDSHNSS